MMEDILIKIFILKSKSCSYSLPKYKIKSSIVSVNKQIETDIPFKNQTIINQAFS